MSPVLQALSASCACSLVERRMYLPYSACLTWRSTSTVMVLSILLLTTRPSTVCSFLVFSFIVESLLAGHGAEQHVHARDFAADTAGFVGLGRGQLARGLLHAERELLLLQVHEVGLQFRGVLLTQVLEFHQ